jgi:hypothetical protein
MGSRVFASVLIQMLVFVDESGDVGIKVKGGSSRYFTVTLLVLKITKKP